MACESCKTADLCKILGRCMNAPVSPEFQALLKRVAAQPPAPPPTDEQIRQWAEAEVEIGTEIDRWLSGQASL